MANPKPLGEIGEVIARARLVAQDYHRLTGKPLGITGEVGECEAARLLGLTLGPPREAGYDATDGTGRRLQIKARSISMAASKKAQRIGSIKLDFEWDAVLLVLMDEELMPITIWEADRAAIAKALHAPGSKARNVGVSQFKSIGRCVWQR